MKPTPQAKFVRHHGLGEKVGFVAGCVLVGMFSLGLWFVALAVSAGMWMEEVWWLALPVTFIVNLFVLAMMTLFGVMMASVGHSIWE
jgi:hypothetical protein